MVGMVRVWSREGYLGWVPIAISCYLMTMGKLTFWFTVSLFIKLRLSLPSRVVVRTQCDKTYKPWSIYFTLMLPGRGTFGCSPCVSHRVRRDPSVRWVWEKNMSSAFSFPVSGACYQVQRAFGAQLRWGLGGKASNLEQRQYQRAPWQQFPNHGLWQTFSVTKVVFLSLPESYVYLSIGFMSFN